ncbi:uncharacterized protein A4U43_C07F26290 [Asparagus officinalis]|uniref:Pentacotripeptide-repeat region of PRORP domain-containing protein n=1 Tax=Asparagus officinalis TaxID=4686 RepID=A0A5P1EF33_ASPOF|nr:pentatricopeptide repeat-containing protein At1g08070, chloroplastic-like [Asparagus officinalis]ONK64462.1 uncharacterized protein A4U43_C07F26290 [Asparagus officinalis]
MPSIDPKTYLHLIDRHPTSLPKLLQIQASLTTSGLLSSHPFLLSQLIQTNAFCFSHAHQILSRSQSHSRFPFNALLRALSLSRSPLNALHLFAKMLHPNSPKPNSSSFTLALKACALSDSRSGARAVHALAIVMGYQSSAHVVNTALHAYASCSDIASARVLFGAIPSFDVIKWNAMISGYVQNGLLDEAFELFRRMWEIGIVPTDVTVISVLSGCARLKNFILGRQIHGFVSKRLMQFEREVNIGTALLDMYAKCGCLDLAKQVFDLMRRRDTGVWNALIAGYVSNGYFCEAIQIFDDLQASGLSPDAPTLVSALCACAHLGALNIGKRIHVYIDKKYPCFNAILGTSLIDMYSKCGCIEISREVFNKIRKKDAMAWTSMIGALAAHGHAVDALKLFDSMKKHGFKPDGVTFVGVLNACRHVGLVEEGLGHFKSMKRDYGIKPRVEHYGCMIDLYSRAGRLGEALELIASMEVDANPIIWRSFLSACRLNLDVELAEVALEKLKKMQSGHCGDYVLLSNIYAFKGRWEDARRVRSWMKEEEIRKKPAFSLI